MTPSSASPPDSGVALLRDLAASPRATGSDAIARARDRLARELEGAGFERRDMPFEFSAFPGRWATPLFGAVALGIVQGAGHFGSRGYTWLSLGICVVGIAAMVIGGRWLARRGTVDLRVMRERGVTMEFTRPGRERPRVWLCAHLDTKSQPIPTLGRVAGIFVTAVGMVGTVALVVMLLAGKVVDVSWWIASAFVTLPGALLVMLSVVTNRSVGALDNASGVAAVVEAARQLDGRDVGVLITDAEELGLAGAREWAGSAAGVAPVILNCDGVDDGGENLVMYSGGTPRAILRHVEAGATKAGISWRGRRLPIGVLTDSVAFADAGLASVTFSRGTRMSLLRVHSRRDDLDHLRGIGIAPVAALMAATANELGGWA